MRPLTPPPMSRFRLGPRSRRVTTALRFALAVGLIVAGAEAGARVVETEAAGEPLVWYDEATQLKAAQMAERGRADTVIVGTSMAWQALVPSVLRQELRDDDADGAAGDADGAAGDVYNAGLAGGVPTVTERWLTEEVVPALEPRRVIWALSSLDFSDVYGDAGLAIYQQAPATREGWLADADRRLRESSALFRQRSRLRDPSQLFGQDGSTATARMLRARDTLGADGERLDFEPAVSEDRALEVHTRISPYANDRDDVAAIVRAVELLRDAGIEVVFVELPVPPRFVRLYDDPLQHQQTQSLLEVMAEELGAPLISLSGEYQDSDFVDFTHLDSDGAERFSRETAQAMVDLGLD